MRVGKTTKTPTGSQMSTEICWRCKQGYETVWRAPDVLWSAVTGKLDGSGLSCPGCFDILARDQGIELYWACNANQFPVEG